MSTSPLITFQSASAPYPVVSSFNLAQSSIGGNFLPVLQGENSNLYTFRVYNNFSLASSIATAINVKIGAFDGVGVASETATKSVTAQQWLRVYETGFGEGSVAAGLYTQYLGTDTAIGGNNYYQPDVGSDGTTTPYIRAGSTTNGLGFIEIGVYAELPDMVGMFSWTFALVVQYEWV